MDSVPKLLPIWHDIALQEFIRQKTYSGFKTLYPPNYGGIGIDLNDNSGQKTSNYAKKQMTFAGNSCALPFLPLRKFCNLKDPCLGALKREKFKVDKFCVKLSGVREAIQRCKSWSNIKALQQQLNVCMESNGNEEINVKAPKSLVDLAENIPKRVIIPELNVAYAGGTLAISKSSNNLNLLHPVGRDQNKLCITPLQKTNDEHFKPDCQRQLTRSLEKGLVLQIEPALNEFCCVRQKDSFHLVNMGNMNIFSKRVHKSSLYHVAISPYNPTEILSVYEKGMMKLINLENRKTWSISEDLCDPSLLCPTWRCGFGSHPYSALCSNEKKVYSFDYREKNYTVREIFSIENPSCHINEELVAIKLWNKNPFQHLLTSNYHLMICDERYPKKPVMFWNHTLKDPPIYLEYADLNSNGSCIVIGTQETQELAAFILSHETDIQPVSLSPPLLLSSPTDCVQSLKLHSYYVDDKFSSRLSCPLSGVCIAPYDGENSFTVLQSTSLGDIFYQDFRESNATEKTYRVSTGCILTPPEKILPHLKDLISGSNDADETEKDIYEDITRLQINIDKVLSQPKEISSNCTLCRLRNFSDEKELVLSEICPTCNLGSGESQHFSKAVTNTSAVIGPSSEEAGFLDCDTDYLSVFKDTYSKRILSVWLESDDLEESQATFDESMVSNDT